MKSEEIELMSYTDFIAFIKETNRCPGGKDTIRKIVQNSFIGPNSRVLEIGCNTGFTSLEVSHLVGCRVDGIDINKNCVDEAKNKLAMDTEEVRGLVHFQTGSAYSLPYDKESFDLVIAGGATAFMEEKNKAIHEYLRVLKTWGFLSITQLFYEKEPPQKLLEEVSEIIGTQINPYNKEEWLSMFSKTEDKLELYYLETQVLSSRPESVIEDYIDYFLNKPHIQRCSKEERER